MTLGEMRVTVRHLIGCSGGSFHFPVTAAWLGA
jgi:hypothetical protein